MPSIIDNARGTTQQQGNSILQNARGGIGAPQISMPEMRTPEQMESQMTEEKELPFGAIGWNVDGTANYGAGVEGWWKGITSRITAPTEEGEAPGVPEQVWRGAVEGVVQLGTLLSQPQQWYYGYLADRRSYEMYADMVNQNMPDLYSDNELGNFLRITTSLIPGISNLTTMYEKDRIKNGSRILPEGTFEKIQEANRIWNKENVGTAIFDTQVQAEYVRRVLAGENPYKVREEYAKPVQNFIADFILDPLNVFEGMGIANKILGKGFKLADGALTAARFADDAADFEKAARVTGFSEDGTKLAKEVVDAASKTLDEKIVQTATKIAQESVEAASKGISAGLFDLTQNAKQVALFDKMYGVFGPLLKFANGDAAKYNDMITAIAMMGSRNADEVAAGMKILQDNKILHLFLSDNAMESARFMNRIKESGAKFDKIAELAKIDKAKYFDEMNKIIKPVMEELYPDLAKIAEAQDEIAKIRKIDKTVELPEKLKKFENLKLSPVQKFMAKRHKELQTAWFGTKIGVKPINEFFSLIYLTSPGFTVRNYLNAAATAFVDLGPASLRELVDFTGGGYKYIEDMFGFVPGSISKQFSIAQDVGEAKGVMKYFDFMRRFAGKGEEYESVAIAAHAGKRFSNAMLREGRFIEKMDTLRKAGFSDQALKFLESRVRKYNGQTALALDDFKKEFAKGTIEHFREPESLFSQELLKSMETWKPSFVDEIRDILKEGTLDDVLKKVDDLFADVESRMRSTLDDIKPDELAEESQMIRGLQQTLDLSDDGIDQFAKKVNVRRNLEDAIVGTASEILPKGQKFTQFMQIARKYSTDVMNFQSKFSTTIRELVTQVANGTLGVDKLMEKIATDPMFTRMGEYVPSIQKNMKRDVAIDTLWTYYKRHMEDLWVNTAKSQYDELMKAIGTTPLKGNKAAMLENLKMRFSIDFKYLNADKLENGEALINLPYYYYKMARNDLSVYEYGKKLGLFASEIQKGAIEGKRIGYRGTIWSVIKDELARIGIKRQIGDINREDEYRWVMARLNDYAVKRNKMEAMRGAIYNYINPMKERAKVLSAIDPLKRSTKETAELTKLNQKTKFMDGMVRIINKKLQAGKLQDIEEFTGNFVEWFAKNADGADVADIIKKAGDETVEFSVDTAKAVVDDVAQTAQKAADDVTEAAVDMDKIDLIPDTANGDIITEAKMLRNQYVGLKQMFNAIKTTISNTYGKVENVSDFNQNQVRVLEEWGRLNEAKMLDFRTRAMSHMKATRDFALLDYAGGKKNIDLALAYIFPYQFWYSRSYTNWIKRLASDPSIINKYNSYREMMAEQNKDLPEYMQNYIVLGKSIGMEENPLMLNLEASLNPLNGLTGVDFTDKNKIVGTPGTIEYAWTKTLDSIGKYGPSPWSPINMATAAALYGRGEKEAAARWFGRFLPQSAPIKAVGSLFNQNWEFDPFVILFGDESGTDPYEQRRVGRALVAMTEAGKITKEQAYEAARLKSGPIWQEATIFSTKNRAAGTISAYVLGQGFKVRSAYEAEIDRFYEDYFKMWANADKFTPDEMSNYQRYIRTKYNFADLVILSGKGSEERDKAYSYSVLSRIAPGQSGDIFRALGVDPALTDKFYQDKGNMQQWNPLDKEAFMNAMVQIGTLVAIPADTTAAEWQQVKTIYKQVDKDLQARFGDDILTKIEAFYELPYDSPEQKNYMEAHPDVAQALDYKDFVIAGNKQIAPYYDGLNRLERYYGGEFRRQVGLRVDPNYYQYYQIRGMIIDPAEQKAFDRQIGWDAMNKKYTAFKKEWDLMVFKQLDNYDKFFLGEAIPTAMQAGVEPSVGQQAIQEILAPAREDERRVTWEQITSAIPMPITLERALQQYVTSDRQLSSSESAMVTRLLNNVNTMYGLTLDKDELLSLAMDYYR